MLGITLTLSTNGTLIDLSAAKKIKELGFRYVGISFDGLGPVNENSKFKQDGVQVEVLTVDNHVDGVYLYLRLKRENPDLAQKALECLLRNDGGANSSGVGIANIDSYGDVHPDQFWTAYTLGNVRERSFSQIWAGTCDPLLAGLRNRLSLLKGRCGRLLLAENLRRFFSSAGPSSLWRSMG